MGELIYDEIKEKTDQMGLKDLRGHNWSLALLGVTEGFSNQSGPIPLRIDPERILFTNYHTFVRALTDQGEPDENLFSTEDHVTLT